MKKIIHLFLILLISSSSFAFSSHPFDNRISQLSEVLLSDQNFADFIKQRCKTKLSIAKELEIKGGSELIRKYNQFIKSSTSYEQIFNFYTENNLDTSKLIDSHVEEVASYYNLVSQNSNFANSSDDDKIAAINLAFNTLKSNDYLSDNSNNACVKAISEINSHLNISAKLKADEAMDCLKDMLDLRPFTQRPQCYRVK